MTLNSVVLVGRIANDPSLAETAKGTKIGSVSLAIDALTKDGDASFINLVLFDKNAENLMDFCKKGDRIGITGKIQVRRWQNDKKETRYTTEIVVNTVVFLEPKTSNADEEDEEEEEEIAEEEEEEVRKKPSTKSTKVAKYPKKR